MAYGASYLLPSGRRKEAVHQLERAVQGDPLHFSSRAMMAMCLGAVGRYAEADAHLRQVMDLNPNLAVAYTLLASNYVARRMFAETLPFAEKGYSLAPWFPDSHRRVRGAVGPLG
jgi:Flp pilus assembly protein TadD